MKAFKQVNLVTCDADFHVYRNGLLVVNEDKIVYCGSEDATWEVRADETVDCEGAWLMPGLVNCHTHSAMTTLRGIRDDSNLHEQLEDYIWAGRKRVYTRGHNKSCQAGAYRNASDWDDDF